MSGFREKLGKIVDFRDFFGVMGIRAKPLYKEKTFAHARAEASFSLFSRGHHSVFPRFLSSMLWIVDATYYFLWFYESFEFMVLLWCSVSIGTRGHKQPTLISMFRYLFYKITFLEKPSLCASDSGLYMVSLLSSVGGGS